MDKHKYDELLQTVDDIIKEARIKMLLVKKQGLLKLILLCIICL